jgi:hypothetical protein
MVVRGRATDAMCGSHCMATTMQACACIYLCIFTGMSNEVQVTQFSTWEGQMHEHPRLKTRPIWSRAAACGWCCRIWHAACMQA